jgi:hypothetical protein
MKRPDKTSRGGSIRKLMVATSRLAEAPEYNSAALNISLPICERFLASKMLI